MEPGGPRTEIGEISEMDSEVAKSLSFTRLCSSAFVETSVMIAYNPTVAESASQSVSPSHASSKIDSLADLWTRERLMDGQLKRYDVEYKRRRHMVVFRSKQRRK